MKDMLASLPQYQEQREKVDIGFFSFWSLFKTFSFQVLLALEYGTRLHGHFREGETCKSGFRGTGMTYAVNYNYRLTVGWSAALRA